MHLIVQHVYIEGLLIESWSGCAGFSAALFNKGPGDKTLGRVRLRKKIYHFHLGHHNEISFVGMPKDLAFHVWYVNHIGFL